MLNQRTQESAASIAYSLDEAVPSWERHMVAENLSPATIRTRHFVMQKFQKFLAARGMPQTVADISREHIQEFITETLRQNKPQTANIYQQALRRLFAWLLDEGEIRQKLASGMSTLRVAGIMHFSGSC